MTDVNPQGWHNVTPRIVVQDAAALVAFMKLVFGATGEYRDDGPSEITIGDSIIMVSTTEGRDAFPAFLYVYVDDADATYERGLRAGAISLEAVWIAPYGDRRGMFKDPWGNVWQVATPTVR